MSPERARVAIAEDSTTFIKIIRELLKDSGHEVVAQVSNLPDALELVHKLAELKVDVLLLDGNLTEDEYKGYDAQAILAEMTKLNSTVKTIGLSGNNIRGVTKDLGKGNIMDLAKAITEI